MHIDGNRYCVYEPIKPRIGEMRLLLVDDLIKTEENLSEVARAEPGFDAKRWVRQERHIASLAMANIEGNVHRLVERPVVRVVHFGELSDALVNEFDPDAIVLSGTLRDFDFYHPALIEGFNRFIRTNRSAGAGNLRRSPTGRAGIWRDGHHSRQAAPARATNKPADRIPV